MATASGRHRDLVVELVSRYGGRYLAELVEPSMGISLPEVTAERIGLHQLLGQAGSPPAGKSMIDQTARAVLFAGAPGRWRFERYDDAGQPIIVTGCDGDWRWVLDRGRLRVWRPAGADRAWRPREPWRNLPHPPLCDILDPLPSLAAITLDRTESASSPFGPALRMSGTPRMATGLTAMSSLVNPMAEDCTLDVHAETGVIIGVRNTIGDDWTLTTHEVTKLGLDVDHDDATFAVPAES